MEKNKTTTDAFRAVHKRALPPLLELVDEHGAVVLLQWAVIGLDCLREAGWSRGQVDDVVDLVFGGLSKSCP